MFLVQDEDSCHLLMKHPQSTQTCKFKQCPPALTVDHQSASLSEGSHWGSLKHWLKTITSGGFGGEIFIVSFFENIVTTVSGAGGNLRGLAGLMGAGHGS